jgi:hydrogenase nickel incorporation protein HypB
VLETRVLARNDEFAERNRALLKERGCVAVNFISSPGSGKTFLLEKTLEGLRDRVKCAVIAGDQQTDNDAVRLQSKGAPVVQIQTGSSCHLNAEQVGEAINEVLENDTRLLFIENVGNLVCPAAFDLGENIKIALLSVTEGEDKPLKYPVIFHDAAASVITKCDLLEHLDVDMSRYRDSLERIHPGGRIFELSALTGDGMKNWLSYLESLVL